MDTTAFLYQDGVEEDLARLVAKVLGFTLRIDRDLSKMYVTNLHSEDIVDSARIGALIVYVKKIPPWTLYSEVPDLNGTIHHIKLC